MTRVDGPAHPAAMTRYLRYGALAAACALLGAMATLGLTARATTPTDQIHACVNNGFLLGLGTGAVRIVAAGTACNAGETALAWTQTGISFAPGAARLVAGPAVYLIPTASYQPVTVSCAANETPLNGTWHVDATGGISGSSAISGGPASYTYPPDPAPTYTVGLASQVPGVTVAVHASVYCLTTS